MIPFIVWLEDRALQLGARIVPAEQQAEWLRAWSAELWYERSRGHHDLLFGLLHDALWLRLESWRQALTGTALLCLVALAALTAVAALPLLLASAAGFVPADLVLHLFPRYAVAAALTLVVGYATSFATVAESGGGGVRWVRASAFHAAKVAMLLALSALVSTDVCLPLESQTCFAAMPLELLLFVVMALLGLRWNFLDGQSRCKQCLLRLAPPLRVGRPSWNFLDYNGTELACREGHGRLSVPEIETSWCRSSAWVSPLV